MLFLVAIFFLIAVYLFIDYQGERTIIPRSHSLLGMNCSMASDLIVQEFDKKGNLWATRGLLVYCLDKGDVCFRKKGRIPAGNSLFWLNNFRIFRRAILRSECVELVIDDSGSVFAISSGRIWNNGGNGKKYIPAFKLPHFGYGIGRGVMSAGLSTDHNKSFFFGEYFGNTQREPVRIYRFSPGNNLWETAYEFRQGAVRHIHAIQSDPYSEKLWICTGDEDNECMIGWSDDSFNTITPIGQGSQAWRACQLVFTEEAVFWGADTGNIMASGIYKWSRTEKVLTRVVPFEGALFYGTRLANGNLVFTSDREGFPNEADDRTRLVILDGKEDPRMVEFGTWNYKAKGFRHNFAKLRLQRSQGNDYLAVSCLNIKEFPDGDMLLIPEEELVRLT